MSRKVLQIGYEPERDRLTWDGWDIHCGQGMDVLLPVSYTHLDVYKRQDYKAFIDEFLKGVNE